MCYNSIGFGTVCGVAVSTPLPELVSYLIRVKTCLLRKKSHVHGLGFLGPALIDCLDSLGSPRLNKIPFGLVPFVPLPFHFQIIASPKQAFIIESSPAFLYAFS